MLINYYFLFNVFFMVLVRLFEEFYLFPLNPLKFYDKMVKKFKFSWAHYSKSKDNTTKLDLNKLINFLHFLGPPLGFKLNNAIFILLKIYLGLQKDDNLVKIFQKIMRMDLNTYFY